MVFPGQMESLVALIEKLVAGEIWTVMVAESVHAPNVV